jgi:asparagine N-glycosylation enzyme membrane subunit Stt3
MSESILPDSSVVKPRRGWLIAATVGVAMVTIALIVTALVTFDKFRFIVGTWFLPIITSGVIAGALVLLVAAFALPERKSWRGMTLILWALIALISPAFGLLFLLPWALLAITLPVVIVILAGFFRKSRTD